MIAVPRTLTAVNSDRYEVSIRLSPDGLSFSGFIPLEANSFFCETFPFDSEASPEQALKDVFFAHQPLSFVFKSLYVLCFTQAYSLVPDSIYDEVHKSLLFGYCHRVDSNVKVAVQPISALNAHLLYGIDRSAYEFLARSLSSPLFIHHLSPMLKLWQGQSEMSHPKLLYALLHRRCFDLVCFERGEMLFLNSFEFDAVNDIVYYIMYACKRLNFNQLEDCLLLYGEKSLCNAVSSVISNYIQNVENAAPRITRFKTPIDEQYSVDILTLAECGL